MLLKLTSNKLVYAGQYWLPAAGSICQPRRSALASTHYSENPRIPLIAGHAPVSASTEVFRPRFRGFPWRRLKSITRSCPCAHSFDRGRPSRNLRESPPFPPFRFRDAGAGQRPDEAAARPHRGHSRPPVDRAKGRPRRVPRFLFRHRRRGRRDQGRRREGRLQAGGHPRRIAARDPAPREGGRGRRRGARGARDAGGPGDVAGAEQGRCGVGVLGGELDGQHAEAGEGERRGGGAAGAVCRGREGPGGDEAYSGAEALACRSLRHQLSRQDPDGQQDTGRARRRCDAGRAGCAGLRPAAVILTCLKGQGGRLTVRMLLDHRSQSPCVCNAGATLVLGRNCVYLKEPSKVQNATPTTSLRAPSSADPS